jgi:uncharacterized tellurite resistance protein B-like protein
MNIFKALVAVAWADGTVSEPEQGMIDALLWAFEATDAEEAELRAYVAEKQLIKDINVAKLSVEEKELLIAHAALLTHADGQQSKPEQQVLTALVKQLGMTLDEAKPLIAGAKDRAAKLASKL